MVIELLLGAAIVAVGYRLYLTENKVASLEIKTRVLQTALYMVDEEVGHLKRR